MRKLLLAAVLAFIPSVASAQFYVEGTAGVTEVPDIGTKDYSINIPSVGLLEASSKLKYAQTFTGGGEAGIRFLGWRLGASGELASTHLDKGTISGTLNGSPYFLEGTGDEIANALGLSFNNNIQIVSANLYYNLPVPVVQPFVGVGVGSAFIENASTEIALSASAGARVALGSRAYVGARYRFTYIQGPQDDIGITYKPIMFHSVSLILGLNLGL
jgi:opacity protein-like surface antigen